MQEQIRVVSIQFLLRKKKQYKISQILLKEDSSYLSCIKSTGRITHSFLDSSIVLFRMNNN